MDIEVHKEYEQIDKENIEVFKKTGLKHSSENRFRCVICGEPACINNSMSNCGHKLICNWCAARTFRNAAEAFEWMNKGD